MRRRDEFFMFGGVGVGFCRGVEADEADGDMIDA